MKTTSTAGKGDPYWYEWTVGLVKVVDMLSPESGIQSVSFQATGIKGWDDVVVRYANGRADFVQVKHSRVGKSITYGNLVAEDADGSSLLGTLFAAWRATDFKAETEKCIIFTNRLAGESVGISSTGIPRPPLFKFFEWYKSELKNKATLKGFDTPKEFKKVWKEWLSRLSPGTDDERFRFLRALEIQANQENLESLEIKVLESLSNIFQIPTVKAVPLFHALDSALRRWTTTHEKVTVEDAFSAMALDNDVEIECRTPPSPAPFFPSRKKALAEVEAALVEREGCPIVFLCAEPGAGKTSLISELSNQRVAERFKGIVALRYFAFRPITPESPLIPPDADHFVRVDRLWFGLLSQLRQNLKGRLRAYDVPLRNSLIPWQEARKHVLRIASNLGKEFQRPFVIVIDGIDHAARAMRYDSAHAKSFFSSLPSPDEIDGSAIRVLLAGQPPESYPEYPAWLRSMHPKIRTIGIGRLDKQDISVLFKQRGSSIPADQHPATLAAIESTTRGNTLAVVFAIEEARHCISVNVLLDRLSRRHLGDGLCQYYSAIWQHAFNSIQGETLAETALACALCLTLERLNGDLMASAFKLLGMNREQWNFILGSLGPLIVEEGDGFRVLHNDIRVYLHGHLAGKPQAIRRQGASMLADYYLTHSNNRYFAQKSLLKLLRDAGREIEWAQIFTVEWVFEAVSLRIPYSELENDCVVALRQGVALRDWNVMLELACATETLERWEDRCETGLPERREPSISLNHTFLPTELFVPPLCEWCAGDLSGLLRDVNELLDNDLHARASALLERWLAGLSVREICHAATGLLMRTNGPQSEEPELSVGVDVTIESLGAACRSVGLKLRQESPKIQAETKALLHFESGWCSASCNLGPFDTIDNCFASHPPRFIHNFESALQYLASDGRWNLVKDLLVALRKSREKLEHGFRAQITWWALRSGEAKDHPEWLQILESTDSGFSNDRSASIKSAISICRALGWKDPSTEPRGIAEKVFSALRLEAHRQDDHRHYKVIFRAAATMGIAQSVLTRRGPDAAGAILPAAELVLLCKTLWEYQFESISAHQDRQYAASLSFELVDFVLQIGGNHLSAVLEVAHPIVSKFPVDLRMESLWQLYARTGNIGQLRTWIRRWFDEDGWLWTEDSSNREEIASDLLPKAREVGEHQLADRVEERLGWLQIKYRGHKDYTFDTPNWWFSELIRDEPEAWRSLGIRLWTLSEACSKQGGDNRSEFDTGELLGKAAWLCGPLDVWQLMTSNYDDCGSSSWFRPTANRIVEGFRERIIEDPSMHWRDKIAAVCLSVGFSRWFDEDNVTVLCRLRDGILSSAENEKERENIAIALKRSFPSEFARSPRPDTSSQSDSSTTAIEESLEVWLEKIGEGEEIRPNEIVRLLREALLGKPSEYESIASRILGSVGVGAAYGWGMYSTGNHQKQFVEIGALASEASMWNLVEAAVKYAGDGNYWSQGVSRNLYSVLIARAANHGSSELRNGLNTILNMHERWARGGRKEIQLPVVTLGNAVPTITTWADLSAHSLSYLLASRSVEIIESVLLGIHGLTVHAPETARLFVELADGNVWKQHWILNASEVWVSLFPLEAKLFKATIERWHKNAPLHQRLQAWLVLRRIALATDEAMPEFPTHSSEQGIEEMDFFYPQRHLLATQATQHGAISFIDIHQSLEGVLERVEGVASVDLSEIRRAIVERLLPNTPESLETSWQSEIRGHGDTKCSSLRSTLILDQALDEFSGKITIPEDTRCSFLQAYLGNENPWMLRESPAPTNDTTAWPNEDKLLKLSEDAADFAEMRQEFYLLATQHEIKDDEMTLAAKIQAFTYREDFVFRLWWEEGASDSKEIRKTHCPSTISGRTFAFDFDDWWEPNYKKGKRPFVFAVGGHQRLTFCLLEWFPARLWRTELGWKPARNNPLLWLDGETPVARYERKHGTTRFTHSGHWRQPVIGRWIVKKHAWNRVIKSHSPLRQRDDFERFSSRVEH